MRLLLVILIMSTGVKAQTAWTWTELDTMPIPISNNAVVGGSVSLAPVVFSFGGIDTTKIWSGITNRSFRYNVTGDSWEEIDPLPMALTNIASAASNVKNKIYIIGGYNVASGGSEISSDEVIIYDPETNSYLPNGASIPVPIDDQVQCVWRDSLIFVITGWSNTTNVTDVQIYDPALDSWSAGTDVPNSNEWKVFGGSGFILGDTIYYFGGASTALNFPANNRFRKGIINPSDPTDITWTLEEHAPNKGYRQGCLLYDESVFWVGGSQTSYNYNGIAYNGTGGVDPMAQIMRYRADAQIWYAGDGAPYGVMDLRGTAQVGPTSWIICGGMDSTQSVRNRTFRLDLDPVVVSLQEEELNFKIVDRKIIHDGFCEDLRIYDLDGKTVHIFHPFEEKIIPLGIHGIKIVELRTEKGVVRKKVNLY